MMNRPLGIITLLIALAVAAPSPGYAWLSWLGIGGKDETTQEQSTDSSAEGKQSEKSEAGPSLADRRLARIVRLQEAIYEELGADHAQDKELTAEQENRLANLARHYESFTTDFPNNAYGFILYGRFLRDVGEFERANVMFLRANQIDPAIASVKQQIGNYLAETGQYAVALPYFLSAIELEPEEAIYHYQLGELIHHYGRFLVDDGVYTQQALDDEMLKAFRNARRYRPDDRRLRHRYAETYFDVVNPDWEAALQEWRTLATMELEDRERQVVALQTARVLLELHRDQEAKQQLQHVTSPALQETRDKIASVIEE